MPPIDSQLPVAALAPPGGGTICLATLIDYVIQRTYHELTVLSELLKGKGDMERKIEIVQFASKTRQLYIRLLALVKWASSASKVDKCAEICNFLEQQSMWFVATADSLAKMARETLVSARLPNFSLPCAIDVLTTGTYPRLPSCIRDKIVPPDPITPHEKKTTLQRLNHVIEYRLVSSDLPLQMRRLKIENGRVKFLVEHEFEITLTLMGDSPSIPWRLLDINILVEDPETGNGKSLVHSMQVNYIHQLVQSRLLENERPLHDLYRVLLFKVNVHVSEDDQGKPLQISHVPAMSPDDNHKVGQAIRSDNLSFEKLLMQTIEVRTHVKLKDLSKEIQKHVDGKCAIKDVPASLHVPVLNPSMSSEVLRIYIDIQRGFYLTSVPTCNSQVVEDIADCLNADHRGLDALICRLRIHLTLLRCEKSVQHLSAVCERHLPLVNTAGHPVEKLSRNKVFIKVPRQSCYMLVAEVTVDEKNLKEVIPKYYLLETSPCTGEGAEDDIAEDVGIKSYLKPGRLVPLDQFNLMHGPYTRLFDDDLEQIVLDNINRKRKLYFGEEEETPAKKMKESPYFLTDMSYILACCEERIPFITLGEELNRKKFCHGGVQVDGEGNCLSLCVLKFPDCEGCKEEVTKELLKNLLSCKFRVCCLGKQIKSWVVEFIFTHSPLSSMNRKEAGPAQRVTYSFELGGEHVKKAVAGFIDEWNAIGNLFGLVTEFAEVYNDRRYPLQVAIDVRSYNYQKLSLAYGATKTSLVNIQWKPDTRLFHMSLGTIGPSVSVNPHVPMLTELEQDLNSNLSLSKSVQLLHDTWAPMMSISKLASAPLQGTGTFSKTQMLSFTVIPQTTTHVRIGFRNINCIDVYFRPGNLVAIRDGAYSLFDTSKVIEGFTPICNLKSFLNRFVDEAVTGSALRRRSTTEDDNPPSPIGVDSMDLFTSQTGTSGSPSSRLRFPGPMTPPSNPHTPASPGASRMSVVTPSPSTAFIGTPSPGNLLGVGSPGNPTLHVPSPGSFVPAPSPQSLGITMQSPATSFISPQSMTESGSPYPTPNLAMPSPGARNWPSSPSMPGPSPVSRMSAAMSPQMQYKDGDYTKPSVINPPSRMLPQRSWTGSIPTILSQEAFNTILTSGTLPGFPFAPASPLERFLGCGYLCKHLPRAVLQEDLLKTVPCTERGVFLLKSEFLQFKVHLNPNHWESLHLKVSTLPELKEQLTVEEIQILEKFFDFKVVFPPYKVNAMTAFIRLLGAPIRILKDCIQIMRLELMHDRNLMWTVQWCLTFPPGAQPSNVPAGTPAVVVKNKVVIMLQLTNTKQGISPSEPQSVFIALLYDPQNNTIQVMEKNQQSPSPSQAAVSAMLRRFNEYPSTNECAIFPAVRDLMANLVLPV